MIVKYIRENISVCAMRKASPADGLSCSEKLVENRNGLTDSKNTWKIQKRRVRLLSMIVICAAFAASLTINLVYIIRQNSEKENTCNSEGNVDRLCLGCKYFEDGLHFLQMIGNVTGNVSWGMEAAERQNGVFCIENAEYLNQLTQMFLLQHVSSANVTGTDRPMAHLTLNTAATRAPPSKLRWHIRNDGTGTAFMNHLEYADDAIVVLEDGSYYVYSFITFRSRNGKDDTFLNHYLYISNGKQENEGVRMLSMDKQTRQKGDWEFQTSFMAGIVHLKSRDRIFTAVSDVTSVYGPPLTNYIGLFKL